MTVWVFFLFMLHPVFWLVLKLSSKWLLLLPQIVTISAIQGFPEEDPGGDQPVWQGDGHWARQHRLQLRHAWRLGHLPTQGEYLQSFMNTAVGFLQLPIQQEVSNRWKLFTRDTKSKHLRESLHPGFPDSDKSFGRTLEKSLSVPVDVLHYAQVCSLSSSRWLVPVDLGPKVWLSPLCPTRRTPRSSMMSKTALKWMWPNYQRKLTSLHTVRTQ